MAQDVLRLLSRSPLAHAAAECRAQLIDDMNQDLLRLILLPDWSARTRKILDHERKGKTCVPDYVWHEMGGQLTSFGKSLLEKAENGDLDKSWMRTRVKEATFDKLYFDGKKVRQGEQFINATKDFAQKLVMWGDKLME